MLLEWIRHTSDLSHMNPGLSLSAVRPHSGLLSPIPSDSTSSSSVHRKLKWHYGKCIHNWKLFVEIVWRQVKKKKKEKKKSYWMCKLELERWSLKESRAVVIAASHKPIGSGLFDVHRVDHFAVPCNVTNRWAGIPKKHGTKPKWKSNDKISSVVLHATNLSSHYLNKIK